MDSQKYKIFLSIAERGSYSKVCADYGYTQSGISKMMINMEEEMGVPLIIRTNQGITLTSEGQELLPYIQKLVNDLDGLENKISKMKNLETGVVRVGAFPSISYVYMPHILQLFEERHSNIRVEIVEEHNIALLQQWLSQGIIDMGLFSRQSGYSCDWITLKTEPFVALLPREHRLASKNVVTIEELFQDNLVVFKPHDGEDPDIGFLGKYYEKYGMPKYTINSDQTIANMLIQNNFVTITPEIIAKQTSKLYDTVYRPLDDYTEREIGIALRPNKKVSIAAQKFIACVRECF